MNAQELDFDLASGRIHAQRFGAADDPLVLCVHGLTANMHGYDWLAERLLRDGRQLVAVDLRGRGRSDITPPGSYGVEAHADDVLAIADALGAERFDLLGWSMGALVTLAVAERAGERLRSATLIDLIGEVEPGVLELVLASLRRLDVVAPSPEAYVDAVRAAGAVVEWSDFWTRLYRYELAAVEGGWSATTSAAACREDIQAPGIWERTRARWSALTMPALVVRGTAPLGGAPFITEADRDALLDAVPGARLLEVDQNHYGVMCDERVAAAIGELLSAAA